MSLRSLASCHRACSTLAEKNAWLLYAGLGRGLGYLGSQSNFMQFWEWESAVILHCLRVSCLLLNSLNVLETIWISKVMQSSLPERNWGQMPASWASGVLSIDLCRHVSIWIYLLSALQHTQYTIQHSVICAQKVDTVFGKVQQCHDYATGNCNPDAWNSSLQHHPEAVLFAKGNIDGVLWVT